MKTVNGWFQREAFMSKLIGRSFFLMIGLLVLVGSGCSTTVKTLSMNDASPVSGSTRLMGPAVTLFQVEEALEQEPAAAAASKADSTLPAEDAVQQKPSAAALFKADPTYLGEGIKRFDTLYLILPVKYEYDEFHANMSRTDMIRTVAISRLRKLGIPAAYQAKDGVDRFMTLPENSLGITMRLRKLAVSTSSTSVVPLIIFNIFKYDNDIAHVALDCQLRQSGTSSPLWEGNGEGRFTTDDFEKKKNAGQQDSNVVWEAVSMAVDQCITKSGLLETYATLSNQRYARLMTNGNKQAKDGDSVKALDAYGQAYNSAQTPEQNLDAVNAMAQLIKALSGNPVIPEDVRKFKVRAEGAIRDKQFNDAVEQYGEALKIAPWWPVGHFNRALVLGETGDYAEAMREMNFYLQLVPDAPNARVAQDKIYDWERLGGK